MIEVIRQPREVWHYVSLKAVNNLVPAVSVIVAAMYGIWAGAGALLIQLFLGALVDLTFFHALKNHDGDTI